MGTLIAQLFKINIKSHLNNTKIIKKKKYKKKEQEQEQEAEHSWRKRKTYHKSSFAMAAFEAGFMIRHSFKRHHINNINSLITSLALI